MKASSLVRATPLGAVLLAAMLGGCGLTRVVQPSPDRLTQWSPLPLPPDPVLAAAALQGRSACSSGDDGAAVKILLQDRRTPQTAAFLFAGPKTFGSCLITAAGGMSSGGSGPALHPMDGKLSVDDNGAGGVGESSVRQLGGRVAPDAAQVRIVLTDGREVVASLGNGYWLAWWPDTARADHVVALDAAGAEIASTEVIE
jgi:hypothetical protein